MTHLHGDDEDDDGDVSDDEDVYHHDDNDDDEVDGAEDNGAYHDDSCKARSNAAAEGRCIVSSFAGAAQQLRACRPVALGLHQWTSFSI